MKQSYDILIQRLENFTKAYYKNLIFRGALSCFAILIVFFITLCLIEYFSFLNSSLRMIFFWTYLGIMTLLIIKLIIIPIIKLFKILKTPFGNQQAAKLIGIHFPEIEDKLINILELKTCDAFSNELINASIDKKYHTVQSFSFQNAIDWKKTIEYLKLSSVPLLILLIIFFSGQTKIISQASNRIINYNTHFEPPAPFSFEIKNSKLETLEKSNFNLNIEIVGREIPKQVFIRYNNQDFEMLKENKTLFSYEFSSLEKDVFFQFFSQKVNSEKYKLSVLPLPLLTKMNVVVSPPKHTKIAKQNYEDTGVLRVPEGSTVTWSLFSKNSSEIAFITTDSVFLLQPDSTGSSKIKQQIFDPLKYSISTSNEFLSFADSLHYNIDVIQDEHPSISIEEVFDSINSTKKLIKGIVRDDYGFSNLILSMKIKNLETDTTITEKIQINYKNNNEVFFKAIDTEILPIQAGGEMEYFFTIYDNDKINGYKQSRSNFIVFKKPTKKDIITKTEKTREEIEKEMEDQLNSLESLAKQIEEIEKSLIEEEALDWKGKKRVENLLKNYQSLQKSLEDIQNKINSNTKERNQVQTLSEKLLKKQQDLKRLFEEIMPDEMKELFKELENSLEEIDKKELQEKINQLKLSNEDIEKELDRNLELLKQFEFDEKLEKVISDLKDLEKKEESLSKKSLDKNTDLNKIMEKQKDNLNSLESLKKEMEELEKLKKELDGKSDFDVKEDVSDIEETMKNSLKQLDNKRKKQASKSQKLSSEKIKDLKKKLEQEQKEDSIEKQMENIETLRQILENLIYFSKSEESLMVEMNLLDKNDPKYIELMHKQGDLRNDAIIIEDSLFALSKRIPQISATINREINTIQQKTEEAIDYFRERETSKGAGKQQYVMTAANNLAVLLGAVLEQIQKDLSSDLPSSQECQKPGSGKPKPSDLKKMQKELADHLEKMRKGEKPGSSDQNFSKELVEMMAKQERIRLALQELQGNLEKEGDLKNLKEALENMEKTEEDIANKKITLETLLRQKQIMSKLLELDSALREQDESEERESTDGINYNRNDENLILKYELLKSYRKELLKTTPPSLTNYYKQKVNDYFNSLLKEDL